MSQEDTVPVLPVVSPEVVQADQRVQEEIAGFDLSVEYGGVSLYDWGQFGSGLFLGFMLALGGSSYAGLFSPCLQQRSLITSAMVLFYGFMSSYIDTGFSD